jgi:hypothetical protein
MAWEVGFLSPLYNILRDVGRWLYERFKPKDPADILKHRTKWKAEFERNLHLLENQHVIIRDLRRMDSYPELNAKEKGISPWFKTEFKDLYHRGFEVFLRIESIKYLEEAKGWVYCHYDEEGTENAYLVGRIPYDVVREVDWSGDEYYGFPHVYCDFNRRLRREPYEEIVFCRRNKGVQRDWFTELAEYESVRKLSKKFGRRDA